jgi:hypothetical protein
LAASPTNFDTTRLRFGDMIAGGAGVVLLISLFLDWYSASVTAQVGGIKRSQDAGSGNAFDTLGFIPVLLLIIAIITIAVVALRALNMIPRTLPISPGALVLVVGGIAALLVLFRLIIVPDFADAAGVGAGNFNVPGFSVKVDVSTGRSFGIFIALLAAIGVVVGGWLTWNEEGRPMPGSAGARGGAPAGGGAIGGGQPGGYAQPAAAQPVATQPVATDPVAPAAGQAQPADWYPDPRGEKRLRYWDGSQWTDHTAD